MKCQATYCNCKLLYGSMKFRPYDSIDVANGSRVIGCCLAIGACQLSCVAMPRPTKDAAPSPKRRGDTVVQKVLEITLRQLAASGYERLSLPDVAAAAGLNKTSIYRRWSTKADLVRDALRSSMGQATALPDTGTLRSDMMALTSAATGFAQSPLGMGVLRMLMAEGFNPEVKGFADALFKEQEKHAHMLVFSRAVERGELSRDADMQMAASALAGALMQRIFVEQLPANKAFLERLIDLVLFGLSASGRPLKELKNSAAVRTQR